MKNPWNPTRIRFFLAAIIAAFATGPTLWAAPTNDPWPAYPGSPAGPSGFIQTKGNLLQTPDGASFLVKGISFGNDVWSNPSRSDGINHHRAVDYQRVKAMGFNAIRFYINYRLFEDDAAPYHYKQGGFEWLDRNIAAARVNGVYLILNMHFPQGGFQSNGAGDALWTNAANQSRLVALWQEIAKRYKDEERIIGYGLLNEPVPTANMAQWTSLAQAIIDAIRKVDPSHLLFVERVNWLKFADNPRDKANLYFPLVSDPAPKPNLVWEFHVYNPLGFTHQNASWIPSLVGSFAAWPDSGRMEATGETWKGFSDTSPTLKVGNGDWQSLAASSYQLKESGWKLAKPVIQAQGIGAGGTIWFDDVAVEEYDSADKLLRTVAAPMDSASGWNYWSANGTGKGGVARDVAGASGGACLTVSGATGDANYGCDALKFQVVPGHKYKIKGKAKGSHLAAGAVVRFRVDFYSADAIQTWDKAYLQSTVADYVAYAAAKNQPVYLGEFGAIADSFKANRGGLNWLGDMLDILKAGNVNYNYHTYHEPAFGLYTNPSGILPDPNLVNQPAIDLFTLQQK